MHLGLDVSNLTVHPSQELRTGIQEVTYQTLLATVELRHEFAPHQISLIPHLLQKCPGTLIPIVPYPEAFTEIFVRIEERLRLPSVEIWGHDLRAAHFRFDTDALRSLVPELSHLHIQALISLDPFIEFLRALNGGLQISHTFHDLAALRYPEFFGPDLAHWYAQAYFTGLTHGVDHAVCVSRHSALDLQAYVGEAPRPRISALPLPFPRPAVDAHSASRAEALLYSFGLIPQNYLIFVGSLEPRKNFAGLLLGFEEYRRRFPEHALRLVLVGGTGWLNESVQFQMRASPYRRDIIRTGYLDTLDLQALVGHSLGLALISYYEGYGLPLAQATAQGVAVLTTLGSSLPEAATRRGYFVDPRDPESISAGIRLMVERSEQETQSVSLPHWTHYARELLRCILELPAAG